MSLCRLTAVLALSAAMSAFADEPKLPGVGAAMQEMIAKNEIAGAITVVAAKNKLLHFETTGFADVARKRPMTPDTLFWIASMTKPVTGVAVLMLQDEGKLNVADPVAKYLPEFANLKTPSGKPANLTITQILTHTSGLGEATGPAAQQARTLADLVPLWLAAPMQYEPGAQWKYTQSGINAARANRRGRERDDLRRVSPEAALRSTRDEEHDVLPVRRAARPTGHGLREEQRDRRARVRAAAPRVRPARPPAAGQRRTLFDCARLRAILPDAAQRRHSRRPPISEPPRR